MPSLARRFAASLTRRRSTPPSLRRRRAVGLGLGLACVLAIGPALPSAADDAELRVANARVPLPVGGEAPSVYFAIQSRSEETRTIVGASSPRAESVTIRRTAVVDGQWASEAMPDGLPIPPRGAAAFAPRGLFLRMLGAENLSPGEQIEIVLEFANGEQLAFEAVVEDG